MIHIKLIWKKKTDISLNETSNNKKIKNEQILNRVFNPINDKINVIMDNIIETFDN